MIETCVMILFLLGVYNTIIAFHESGTNKNTIMGIYCFAVMLVMASAIV